jgi:hypothetical protein
MASRTTANLCRIPTSSGESTHSATSADVCLRAVSARIIIYTRREHASMKLCWTRSEGGPLLLLERTLLPAWGGIEPPPAQQLVQAHSRASGQDAATDYDRACDRVYEEISVLAVGEGFGLVLGDEPVATGLVSGMESLGNAIVRRISAWTDDEVVKLLAQIDPSRREHVGLLFEIVSGTLVLFDAAKPGLYVDHRDPVMELRPGCYRVSTSHVTDGQDTSVVVHRFEMLTSS